MKETVSSSASQRRAARARVIQVCAFLTVFFLLAITAFIIPLRPTYSDMEQRDLETFPAFSLEALVSGTYFDEINVWFADTFPMRDMWMQLSTTAESLYGVSGMAIHGEVQSGDEIPDVPLAPVTTPSTTTATVTTTTTATASTTTTTVAATTTTTVANQSIKPPGQDQAPAETIGAILTIGDSGFEYYNFSQSAADTYIHAVNRAGDQLAGIANVYDVVVPTSIDICVDPTVKANLNSSDQLKAIRYMYGSMNANVKTVDAYTALANANAAGDYLYFRTDHHWTALGAYRTYEQFCAVRGVTPTPLSTFIQTQYPGYLGSFYRETQSAAMAANPDVVQAFIPPSTNTMTITDQSGSTFAYPIVTDVSTWSELWKYNTFIGGDNPISTIHNPNKQDGSSCVLIKESFGNAYAPFLVEDYQTVYVLDYRYFSKVDDRSLKQFVVDNGIDDVIFMNNISATRNASLMNAIDALVE